MAIHRRVVPTGVATDRRPNCCGLSAMAIALWALGHIPGDRSGSRIPRDDGTTVGVFTDMSGRERSGLGAMRRRGVRLGVVMTAAAVVFGAPLGALAQEVPPTEPVTTAPTPTEPVTTVPAPTEPTTVVVAPTTVVPDPPPIDPTSTDAPETTATTAPAGGGTGTGGARRQTTRSSVKPTATTAPTTEPTTEVPDSTPGSTAVVVPTQAPVSERTTTTARATTTTLFTARAVSIAAEPGESSPAVVLAGFGLIVLLGGGLLLARSRRRQVELIAHDVPPSPPSPDAAKVLSMWALDDDPDLIDLTAASGSARVGADARSAER